MIRRCILAAATFVVLLAAPASSATLPVRHAGGSATVCPPTLPGNTPDYVGSLMPVPPSGPSVLHSLTDQGSTLKTVYGVFGFGTYFVDRGSGLDPDLVPTLNGRPIANNAGIEGAPITARVLIVANCGQLFALTLSSIYNAWSSNSWTGEGDGSAPTFDPLPPAQVSPPYTPSTDGTDIVPGTSPCTGSYPFPSGCKVVSIDGTWTFGPSVSGGGNELMLNGAGVGDRGPGLPGIAVDEIQINSHGNVWFHPFGGGFGGGWGMWLGQTFFLFGSDAFGSPHPIPAPTSAVIPTAISIDVSTASPPSPHAEFNGTLSSSATIGTVIGTLTAHMSDGTTGTCGSGGLTCSVGATPSPVLTFTGSISGTTLTAGTPSSPITISGVLSGGSVAANTVITAQTSGPTGGAGTYTVSISQTVGSTAMTATGMEYASISGNNVVMGVNGGVPGCGFGYNHSLPLSVTVAAGGGNFYIYKLFGVSPVGC